MSDLAEQVLHALGGALMAALELWLTGNAALAVLWPLLVGWTRESEQSRASRKALEEMTEKRVRPGAFWHWSSHRVQEALAWPVGALVAVGVFALL